jgi:hypothetical protein
MSPPYRNNVISLIPLPSEPKELFQFYPWHTDNHLVTAQMQIKFAAADPLARADVYCPKCSFNTLYVISVLCTGKKVGLCKKVKCAELREHFHVKCTKCDWRTLMAAYKTEDM